MVSFRDDAAMAAFRQHVRSEIDGYLAQHKGEPFDQGRWFEFLRERRWYVPAWPKEYGGGELSVTEQFVLSEELALRRLPRPGGIGIAMAGPTIITHGTGDQKRRFLPGLLDPGEVWCQLYSEPGAGSDLASLQTRAVRDGDVWRVTGQKIWTSGGHEAKYGILLARTDPDAPKHAGITYFIVDMRSPGITVRPLVNMAGLHHFNEVFLEDVEVPHENVVGEVNRGWYVGTTTLNFERSNIGSAIEQRRQVEDLAESVRRGVFPNTPIARMVIADLFICTEIASLLSYRVISQQARGVPPSVEASVSKLYSTELSQRIAREGMRIAGMYGPVSSKPWRRGPHGLRYLLTVPTTIAGGTSEIQRNLIAQRGLGLPRD